MKKACFFLLFYWLVDEFIQSLNVILKIQIFRILVIFFFLLLIPNFLKQLFDLIIIKSICRKLLYLKIRLVFAEIKLFQQIFTILKNIVYCIICIIVTIPFSCKILIIIRLYRNIYWTILFCYFVKIKVERFDWFTELLRYSAIILSSLSDIKYFMISDIIRFKDFRTISYKCFNFVVIIFCLFAVFLFFYKRNVFWSFQVFFL